MIIKDKIKKEDLKPPFVKAVADTEREIISFDCELHVDCAEELLKDGSRPANLWGFNIYPEGNLDFVSLINIRPPHNRKIEIGDGEIRKKITTMVEKILL